MSRFDRLFHGDSFAIQVPVKISARRGAAGPLESWRLNGMTPLVPFLAQFCGDEMRGIKIAQRIGREIPESAHAPVDILQATVGIGIDLQPKRFFELLNGKTVSPLKIKGPSLLLCTPI